MATTDPTQPANPLNATTGTTAAPNSTITAATNPATSPLNVAQTGVTNANLTTATQPAAGLVSNNVTSLIDQNSPLMQRAAAKAMEQANSRGMLNSSMAVGDAQNAVIANALPIAQQDATSQNQFALTNANAANTNSQFNAGASNTVNTQNTGAVNTATNQQAAQLASATQQANTSMQSASTEHDRQIAAIMATDPNTMTSEAKNAAIATLNANFASFQKSYAALGTMGIPGLLDFSASAKTTAPGTPTPGSNAAYANPSAVTPAAVAAPPSTTGLSQADGSNG